MAEVSFYILPTQSQHERLLFACKLIEKAYRSGCFCYVLTDTAGQSQQIDNLLWTFRAGSFIPHQLYSGDIPTTEQVLIGSLPAPAHWQKTVINLSSQCANAERVLEILDNSEATKAVGRDRYRHYKEAGHNLTTHKM
ncbi:DNA polymerase III subunit chi [Crenothrix sp. D3]|nr:DNA polymerase III subunit chi [Crenothrix sp. D3]